MLVGPQWRYLDSAVSGGHHHHEPWPNSASLTGLLEGAAAVTCQGGEVNSTNLGPHVAEVAHMNNPTSGFEAMFSDD